MTTRSNPPMTVPPMIADPLLTACLGQPAAHAALGRLCDTVGGRTSGAASGARAEAWAHDLLTGWGLENVRYEAFEVLAWERGELEATVTATASERGDVESTFPAPSPVAWRLTALAHGYAPAAADVAAAVLDVGHGERADFERLRSEVIGRVILCDEGASDGRRKLHRSEKLGLAVEFGAAGLMIQSSADGGLPRTGVCYHGEAPIPSLGISLEDGERLRRLIRQGATPEARIRMTNTFATGTARNVLADLRGRERPDEVVLAGAHLDSWDVAQGATDNGLGSAIVLEMARALAALGQRPRRTLRFALWAAEETGLFGSKHYVAEHAGLHVGRHAGDGTEDVGRHISDGARDAGQHAGQHTDDLSRHMAVMNFDMTGDPYGYWTPGHRDPGPLLRGLVEQLAPLGMREVFQHKAGLHSDHQPFMLAGVPVVGLLGELGAQGARYYHSIGDTFEKVSLPALCRAAAVGAHTLWALADAPEPPFPHQDPAAVRAMIDAAELYDALVVEGYDGPAMFVER